MTQFEQITKNVETLADLIIEIYEETPFAPCDYCIWESHRTPIKEAKQHCNWGKTFKESYHDCRNGVILFLQSEV